MSRAAQPQRVTVKAKRLGDEWRVRAYVDGEQIAEAYATAEELLAALDRVQAKRPRLYLVRAKTRAKGGG